MRHSSRALERPSPERLIVRHALKAVVIATVLIVTGHALIQARQMPSTADRGTTWLAIFHQETAAQAMPAAGAKPAAAGTPGAKPAPGR